MRRVWTCILCFLLISGIADSVPAQEEEVYKHIGAVDVLGDGPSSLNLGLGVFDMLDEDDSATGLIEWRFGDKLGFIGPLAGVIANVDGGLLGYAGVYTDLVIGKVVISPQTGVAAYEQGDSKNLGGVFEFFSALTVSYRLENDSQVGIRYGHSSNADLYNKNPGTDLLLLQYRIPF